MVKLEIDTHVIFVMILDIRSMMYLAGIVFVNMATIIVGQGLCTLKLLVCVCCSIHKHIYDVFTYYVVVTFTVS